MFKYAVVFFAMIAFAVAKPAWISAPLTYSASGAVIAAPAPFVTATSSQYIARNHNGVASAPVVAPVAAPLVAKPFAAYTAPVAAAYNGPLAYSAPIATKYAAAYSYPLTYSAPLNYAAATAPVLF